MFNAYRDEEGTDLRKSEFSVGVGYKAETEQAMADFPDGLVDKSRIRGFAVNDSWISCYIDFDAVYNFPEEFTNPNNFVCSVKVNRTTGEVVYKGYEKGNTSPKQDEIGVGYTGKFFDGSGSYTLYYIETCDPTELALSDFNAKTFNSSGELIYETFYKNEPEK